MKIEVNESVRSFVTEDSDEPALSGKIHTFLGLTRAALVTKYLFENCKDQKHELTTCVIFNEPF